MSEQLDY